jgi:hypothetical protein
MPGEEWFAGQLEGDDDPGLWQTALDYILAEVELTPGVVVEVGRCSHWERPHQSRWTADGGFALPSGYSSGSGYNVRLGLPQFDWSILLAWTGTVWEPVERRASQPSLRIAIPSRTKRHAQASVHSLWLIGREKEVVYYGFRKGKTGWACTASSRSD